MCGIINNNSFFSPTPPLNEVLPVNASKFEHLQLWLHNHPTTVKVLKVGAFLAGAGMLGALPYIFTVVGIQGALALGVSGISTLAVSALSYGILDLVAPPQHDMQTHTFTPSECEGGRLYYQGDVPILSLDADSPFLAGKAHGYLLGASLNLIFKQLDFALHSLGGQSRSAELTKTLEEVKATIPEEYLEEMQGMLEGFTRWSNENFFSCPRKMTLEDIVLIHLMPDNMHFNPATNEKRKIDNQIFEFGNVACSVVIDYDENGDLIFARNMDWPSFGLMGAHSLVINRKHKNSSFSTVEVGIPGFLGTLTGMNSEGLSLCMNVCSGSTTSVRGMPAAFFNRKCLESCSSVDQLDSFVSYENPPLGPYHLSAADAYEATSFHFYQSVHGQLVKRRKSRSGSPLVTLNDRYPRSSSGDQYAEKSLEEKRRVLLDSWPCDKRQAALAVWFEEAEERNLPKSEIIARSLALPHVNNVLTTHSVLMNPYSKTMAVSLNNAYAAKYPRHTVATEELFSN